MGSADIVYILYAWKTGTTGKCARTQNSHGNNYT